MRGMHNDEVKRPRLKKHHLNRGENLYNILDIGLKCNRRGSQIIVIHPGSRYIRIGKASDVNPVSVPSVVARRAKVPFTVPERIRLVSYPLDHKQGESSIEKTAGGDSTQKDDPVSDIFATYVPWLNHFFSLTQSYPLSPSHFAIECDFINYE
jgi:hypothetical protein